MCSSDLDFMINVPVMKGHCQTKITCALKNMKVGPFIQFFNGLVSERVLQYKPEKA